MLKSQKLSKYLKIGLYFNAKKQVTDPEKTYMQLLDKLTQVVF